jgi:endonuclease YncB( thermonuclease family)
MKTEIKTLIIGLAAGLGIGVGGTVALTPSFNRASQIESTVAILAKGSHVAGKASDIHDGDTLKLSHAGQDIALRIWGIDAPEIKQMCTKNGKSTACGQFAREGLTKIINGAAMNCEMVLPSYNRWVATCITDSGINIGAEMVRQGYATADMKYSKGAYKDLEDQARSKKLGIWSMQMDDPTRWRDCNNKKKNRPADCPATVK